MGLFDNKDDAPTGPQIVPVSEDLKAWKDEVQKAIERQKAYVKKANFAVDIYEAQKEADNSFNVLYSNTETILPTLISAAPKPIVRRRYGDEDPLGKAAGEVGQRILDYLINTNNPNHPTFLDCVATDVLGALVPGRGMSWVRYEAGFAEVEESLEESAESIGEGKTENETDEAPEDEALEQQKVSSEFVYWETVPWDCILMGYSRTAGNVPWLGRIHMMTRSDLVKAFGELGNTVKLDCDGSDGGNTRSDSVPQQRDSKGAAFAKVFEIWDKNTRKTFFFTMTSEQFLKMVDDPMQLEGFFPGPLPLQFIKRLSTLVPIPPYEMYRTQAKELNSISTRINKIVAALKVRGFYDGQLKELERLMSSDDNVLIPAQNVPALQARGLDQSIWMMPIEKLIAVLQQLYLQRQQCKAVIYEITGLSDIQRGVAAASESATASNLKDKWGSLRLSRMQGDVENYVCSLLRLGLETTVQLCSEETIRLMTQLPFPSDQEKQQAQMAVQQAQMQAQQTGQPPQIDPQMEAYASSPSWGEILGLLKNDLVRNFVITIETDSTVASRMNQDKSDVMEFMNAFSQLLNGVQPLVQEGYLDFNVAKTIMMAVVRKFPFGEEIERQLSKLQQPQQPQGGQPDPKAEADKAAAQVQAQSAQLDFQLKQQEMQFKSAQMQAENALKQQELQMRAQEMVQQAELSRLQHQLKVAQAQRQMLEPVGHVPNVDGA